MTFMSKITKSALAGVIVLAGAVGAASSAHAIKLGQVQFTPNAGPAALEPTNTFAASTFVQSPIDPTGATGQELTGFGRINEINGINNFLPAGWELTFEFDGFIWDKSASDVDLSDGAGNLKFSGGQLRVYQDSSADFSSSNAATAGDGSLWLQVDAAEFSGVSLEVVISVLLSSNLSAASFGFFNVDLLAGAIAGTAFDQDAFSNGTDVSFSTSLSATNSLLISDLVAGTANIKADVVPVPGALGFIGLGLLAAGALTRRRRK